ncbi:MAG: hypothetical protein AAF226_07160 [Verrucomicrobiota bacterium]
MEKDLFYYTTGGEMKVKTYSDSGLFESSIRFIEPRKDTATKKPN